MKLRVNGKDYEVEVPGDVPLLWVIREELGLTGTKFGCGKALCGACTVHVDGRPRRSCVTSLERVAGREVTTVEGLTQGRSALHAVQQAWIEMDVPQCGYCQAGQIMAATDLLSRNPEPSDEDIDREMTNICRCGTYVRLRKAIHRAVELAKEA